MSEVLTLREAAKFLKVSKMTVSRWMKKRDETGIPGRKIGTSYLFDKDQLVQWVRGELDSPTGGTQ